MFKVSKRPYRSARHDEIISSQVPGGPSGTWTLDSELVQQLEEDEEEYEQAYNDNYDYLLLYTFIVGSVGLYSI